MTEPVTDDDGLAFREGLTAGELRLQRCTECGRHRFPPMPSCPFCGIAGGTDVEVDGRGALYSWVVVHRALTPSQEGEVPYTIATVELPEGIRMVGRLDGEPADRASVEPVFVDHDDWTELRFRVAP